MVFFFLLPSFLGVFEFCLELRLHNNVTLKNMYINKECYIISETAKLFFQQRSTENMFLKSTSFIIEKAAPQHSVVVSGNALSLFRCSELDEMSKHLRLCRSITIRI